MVYSPYLIELRVPTVFILYIILFPASYQTYKHVVKKVWNNFFSITHNFREKTLFWPNDHAPSFFLVGGRNMKNNFLFSPIPRRI